MGLDFADINKELTINDVWNGWISVDAQADNLGNFYVPIVGDNIKDDTSGSTAEVTYVKTIEFNRLQLFLKNASGIFFQGSDAGAPTDIILLGTPNRKVGVLKEAQIDTLGQGGPYFVFDSGKTLKSATLADIEVRHFDLEYRFWDESTLDGVARTAEIPGNTNKNYLQVYNIIAGDGYKSAKSNQGAYVI